MRSTLNFTNENGRIREKTEYRKNSIIKKSLIQITSIWNYEVKSLFVFVVSWEQHTIAECGISKIPFPCLLKRNICSQKTAGPHYIALCHCSWDNILGFVPCKVLSEVQEGQNYCPSLCSPYIYLSLCLVKEGVLSFFFFFLAVRAAGVFSCDRQELDMKGTANSKYDLINYICQWFPADLSLALHMLPLSQPTSQPVNQSLRKFSAAG